MLHNGMFSPAGEDMTWQQQQQLHNYVDVVVPYDASAESGSLIPLLHGFCCVDNNLVSAEVLDLQDHKPDTLLGAHDLPTFGDLSLAAKVAVATVRGNTNTTTSAGTRITSLDHEMDNCFSKTCSSCCQMSMEEEIAVMDEKVCDDVVFIDNNEPNSSKDSLATRTKADDDDDEKVVVVEECQEQMTEVEAKLESKPTKRSRAVISAENSKASAVHKPNYIHVRARRGQATDSHSLAERARREKISRKMKCLQDLVPGCSKITGKAGVLDEIINYVQSLQRQVEFLSMKLETQSRRLGFNVDNFSAHEIPAHAASFPAAPISSASANLAELQLNPGQQVTTNYELERPIYAPQNAVETTTSSSVSIPELYTIDSSCFTNSLQQIQPLPTWDSDLLSLEEGVLDQE